MIRSTPALRMNFLVAEGLVHRVCHNARTSRFCLVGRVPAWCATFGERPQTPRSAANSRKISHRVGDSPRRKASPSPTRSGPGTLMTCGANDPNSQCSCLLIQSLDTRMTHNPKRCRRIRVPFAKHTLARISQRVGSASEPYRRGGTRNRRAKRYGLPGIWIAAFDGVRTPCVPAQHTPLRLHVRHPGTAAAPPPA